MNWPFWLELLARSAVLLIAGAVLRWFSKAHSAAFRHRLVLWIFTLLALLPLLSVLFPEIRIPLWRPAHIQTALVSVQEVSSQVIHTRNRHAVNWPAVIWLLGALIALTPILAGAITAHRIAHRATPLNTPALADSLWKLSPRLTDKAKVFLSGELRVPLTCGLVHPRILLPATAVSWTCSRLQSVLAHELAHVRRRDVAAQLAVHVIAALWWFQPLVWIFRRILRAESEFACDAEAIGLGFRRSEYAMELLAVAKAAGTAVRTPSLTISMVRCSGLEERVRAILNPPSPLRGRVRTYILAMALASMAVVASAVDLAPNQNFRQQGGSTMKRRVLAALLTSAGLSASTISGTVSDPSGAALPDVHVLISNPDTGMKHEAVTGAGGGFTFDGDAAGQYILRLDKPGFVSIFREFDLKADSKIDRDFTMVNEGGPQVADKDNASQGESKAVRVRGEVAQSNLTTKVQPIYPAEAKAARVQGTVEIEATISKDGVPVELRVISSPSDDLSQSALEAVRQWRYRPTLLNGNPIEIVTDIVVNYTLSH